MSGRWGVALGAHLVPEVPDEPAPKVKREVVDFFVGEFFVSRE